MVINIAKFGFLSAEIQSSHIFSPVKETDNQLNHCHTMDKTLSETLSKSRQYKN